MILHEHDRTKGRLRSCWRRAAKLAKKGEIDKNHRLAAAWSNCKMFIDAREPSGAPTFREQTEEDGVELAFNAICLDWFAGKLDAYAKNNMLDGDATVAAILYEWRAAMPFHPDPPKKKA